MKVWTELGLRVAQEYSENAIKVLMRYESHESQALKLKLRFIHGHPHGSCSFSCIISGAMKI